MEIPVLPIDGLEGSTDPASLPPDPIAQFATGVKPLVCNGIDKLEILNLVILLVAIDVVHAESIRDESVFAFPHDIVAHTESAFVEETVVSILGDPSPPGWMGSSPWHIPIAPSFPKEVNGAAIKSPGIIKSARTHATTSPRTTRNGWFPVASTDGTGASTRIRKMSPLCG
jgi:hypothetical protein